MPSELESGTRAGGAARVLGWRTIGPTKNDRAKGDRRNKRTLEEQHVGLAGIGRDRTERAGRGKEWQPVAQALLIVISSRYTMCAAPSTARTRNRDTWRARAREPAFRGCPLSRSHDDLQRLCTRASVMPETTSHQQRLAVDLPLWESICAHGPW